MERVEGDLAHQIFNSRAPFVVIDDPIAPHRQNNVETILAERVQTHGDFKDHSYTAQQLKSLLRLSRNWDELSCPMRESLEMIMHKVARIVSGDPSHRDHWDDIAGYSTLVSKGLKND